MNCILLIFHQSMRVKFYLGWWEKNRENFHGNVRSDCKLTACEILLVAAFFSRWLATSVHFSAQSKFSYFKINVWLNSAGNTRISGRRKLLQILFSRAFSVISRTKIYEIHGKLYKVSNKKKKHFGSFIFFSGMKRLKTTFKINKALSNIKHY